MKIVKCIISCSFLLFQTSICFAGDSVNLSVAPDPATGCNQFRIDVALTEHSTLGVMPAHCTDRPSRPSRFFGGDMKMNSQVTNKFNRILIPWRYSPYGVFSNGFFVEALIGVEKSELKSASGSSANVTFIDTGVWLGYQWIWHTGLNIAAVAGINHLTQNSIDKNISPAESSNVSDYLNQQTSTNTHVGGGVFLGWAF
ncbi:hypothetical protein [Sideroxydans sp. CL21]|uniref:hypothetical protein n=1 Tax=Sideroxydans sp. CL21 TaxID=2600596 RepID=UPI0012A9AE98|nr:hypothetical protein [Sideroxydans sp. CL21]VVC82436.1 hypothetical protein [Sideroxydans sp. CL21]